MCPLLLSWVHNLYETDDEKDADINKKVSKDPVVTKYLRWESIRDDIYQTEKRLISYVLTIL